MHLATLKTSFVKTQQPLLQMKDTVPSSVIAAQASQRSYEPLLQTGRRIVCTPLLLLCEIIEYSKG